MQSAPSFRAAKNQSLPDYSFDFKVTPRLKTQVEFWKKIYSKYNSKQVVIHDKEHLGVVYTVLDFSDLENTRSSRLRRRKRRHLVKKAKEKYRRILRKLARKRYKVEQLNKEEKRIYDLFAEVKGRKKFYRARSWRRIRAQTGQKDRFRKAIIRSGHYLGEMEKIFQAAGLPVELTRLPFVESFFNTHARSKRGATGMWQFMYSTGRNFLQINHLVDERKDPYLATEAAAKLLTRNYDRLGSWPLALTAYNHGAMGVARGLRRTQAETLEELIENYNHRRFGFASKNFYAEFLAALEVCENYRKYFGLLSIKKALQYDTVELPYYTNSQDITKHCNLSRDELKELNPALRRAVLKGHNHIPKGYPLHIPAGSRQAFLAAYERIPKERKYLAQKRNIRHRVRRGESLSLIARRYRCSIESIVAANNLKNRHFVRVGQYLRIPTIEMGEALLASGGSLQHRVRRGETLSKIAKRYRTSVSRLVRANNLSNRHFLQVGQKLIVPQPQLVAYRPRAKQKTASQPQVPEIETQAASTPQEEIIEGVGSEPPAGQENELLAEVPAEEESTPTLLIHEITVHPHETIGHYAEWARLPARSLRRLNSLKYRQQIHVGQKLAVELSQVTRAEFDKKRQAFQEKLEQQYLSQYKVEKVLTHTLKPRQNAWYLCRYVYNVPLWLVKKYNADKNLSELNVGDKLLIPVLKEM